MFARRMFPPGVMVLQLMEGLHDGDKRTKDVFEPEMCPAMRWTVGFGTVLTYQGRQLEKEKDRALAMQVYRKRWPNGLRLNDAERLVVEELSQREVDVAKTFEGHSISDSQFAAGVLFQYNTGSIGRASWVGAAKAGDMEDAGNRILLWNKVKGEVVPGLVKRRHLERAFWMGFVRTVPEARNLLVALENRSTRAKTIADLLKRK